MIDGGSYSIPHNMKIYINIMTIISYIIIAHIPIFEKKKAPELGLSLKFIYQIFL